MVCDCSALRATCRANAVILYQWKKYWAGLSLNLSEHRCARLSGLQPTGSLSVLLSVAVAVRGRHCVTAQGGLMEGSAQRVSVASLAALQNLTDSVLKMSVWRTKCACQNVSSGVRYSWLTSMLEGFTALCLALGNRRVGQEDFLLVQVYQPWIYLTAFQFRPVTSSLFCVRICNYLKQSSSVLFSFLVLSSELSTQKRKKKITQQLLLVLVSFLVFAIYCGNY